MNQNRSTAVMQRRVEPHDSLDDFPTPPWATRALCEHVINHHDLSAMTVCDPACNRGYMARPLLEYFESGYFTDVHDYGYERMATQRDFCNQMLDPYPRHCWFITNPPFRLAQDFLEHGLHLSDIGMAVIVRSAFLEGIGRYEELFSKNPPSIIAQFVERCPMVKGKYDPTVSTATSYSWLVWEHENTDTRFFWIPPCRKSLEREGDFIDLGASNSESEKQKQEIQEAMEV